MSTMTKDLTTQIPTAVGLLSVICVIGSIGNIIVILIYSQKRVISTANQFIKILAISDCIVCLVIIPYTIYIELMDWKVSTDIICKSYYFLNNSSIPFGSLLITLIAVDRYLCICYPFLSLMSVKRSKICVFIFLILSIILGILSVFQVKVFTSFINKTDSNLSYSQSECIDVSRYAKPTYYETIFFTIVQRSQLISYTICIGVVICLYILIYRSVLTASRKKARMKGLHKSSFPFSFWSKFRRDTSVNQSNSESNNDDATMSCQNDDRLLKTNQKLLKRKLKETILLQNLRTALMLFVVTVTYIVSFLPACLMVNNVLSLYLPVFYMYYINNAANPIIYCFMNKNFRDDVRNYFQNLLIRRH